MTLSLNFCGIFIVLQPKTTRYLEDSETIFAENEQRLMNLSLNTLAPQG